MITGPRWQEIESIQTGAKYHNFLGFKGYGQDHFLKSALPDQWSYCGELGGKSVKWIMKNSLNVVDPR